MFAVTGILFTIVLSLQSAFAQENGKKVLQFKYKKGDRFSLVSKVEEDVRANGKPLPHMTILNRVSMETTNVDDKGRGFFEATFRTTEIE